jgi:ATP-dependent Clp protease ATP-binding subunit ClpC
MTTNLGAKVAGEAGKLGFSTGNEITQDKERVEKALRRVFRPEFLNRIDEIIYFRSLNREDLIKIASLLLVSVTDRIESTGVFIELDASVAETIADQGHADEYGARQLRRAITKLVEDPYSSAFLSGQVQKGDLIRAYGENGKVIFEKKRKTID